MALSKQGYSFLGFTFDAYAKIKSVKVEESGSDEAGKLYDVFVEVRLFTGPDKANGFDTVSVSVPSVREASLSIPSVYSALKTLPQFEGFIDA